ncbi:MAG: hypothetical protein LM517_06560 [Nitrosomonas sp.]|nr:hypothetical protein [Nitrosomonas sp.]
MIENLAKIITITGRIISVLSMGYLLFADRVVEQNIESEKIQIGNNKLEISKVFGVFIVSEIIAVLPFIMLSYIPSLKEFESINNYSTSSSETQDAENSDPIKIVEKICLSLIGKYKILREYMFIDTKTSDLGVVTGLRGKLLINMQKLPKKSWNQH